MSKKRLFFVSNSSSSSFVLAVDDPNKLKVTIEVDLSDLVDSVVKTEEDLKKYCLEELYPDDEGHIENNSRYKKYLKKLKQGKTLLFMSCCNDDGNAISGALYENGLSLLKGNKFEVIDSDDE
jgi:hypothetical protein